MPEEEDEALHEGDLDEQEREAEREEIDEDARSRDAPPKGVGASDQGRDDEQDR